MRVSRHAGVTQLYFPPLRTPEVAFALALFGLVCLAISSIAIVALSPAVGSDAYGMLVIALFGAFVGPFPVFGVVFVALAVYMVANSLTVDVSLSGISMTRRVFGVRVARRELATGEIADIEPQIAAKYQSLFGGEPYFRLIARHTSRRQFDTVVAESLKGEPAMSYVRDLIVHDSQGKPIGGISPAGIRAHPRSRGTRLVR